MKKELSASKNFAILLAGQFVSLFGNSFLRYSLSLYILELTGSVQIYSLTMALTVLPQIFIAPYGGALADRMSKKKIMIILDTVSGVLLLLYGLYNRTHNPSVIGIGVLICLMSIIQNIYDPVVRASIPIMVEPNKMSKANSTTQLVSVVSSLLGPVLAGFIYGLYGIGIVLFLDGISFLLSAGLEVLLQIPHEKKQWKGNPFVIFTKELIDTFHYVKREKKVLLNITYISAGLNFMILPIYIIGIPYLEKEVFHVSNQLYGISEMCIGLGVVAGALISRCLDKKLPISRFHWLFILLSVIILAMGTSTLPVVMGVDAVSYLSYLIMTVTGFLFTGCITVSSITSITFIQKVTPMEQMGKIIALVNAFSTAFLPLGQVLFGWMYSILAGRWFILYAVIAVITLYESLVIRRMVIKEGAVLLVEEQYVI